MAGTFGLWVCNTLHWTGTYRFQFSSWVLEKKDRRISNQTIHLEKKSLLWMLLRYCFWTHITFPLASLGVLERKLKAHQQTVILHLLPGCSAPASCSPKGCMGRLGSQTQRSPSWKSIQKPAQNTAHTHHLDSSTADQLQTSAIIFFCSLAQPGQDKTISQKSCF